MPKTTQTNLGFPAPGLSMLPANVTVKALVVGIEDYQPRSVSSLSKVDYAREDAEGFMTALEAMYSDRLIGATLVDNNATRGNIEYELQTTIQTLEADDLFIFYYAGHGFFGHGGNRITAWDTHPHHIDGTTLRLRDVLLDPLQASPCRRALTFVDACAANFTSTGGARDVISDFSPEELKEYLAATEFFAMYLSCSPGQKSYPSDRLKHGIWTHFLLQALRGEAHEALDSERYLTDQTLKNYLRTAVRQYMTKETTHKGTQTPEALIRASGTFAIRHVPLPIVPVRETGDLRDVRIKPSREFFQGIEEGEIKGLPGFNKRTHFVPDHPDNPATTSFIKQLLAGTIQEETQELYEHVKEAMALRSREVEHESENGFGSIDTDYFRYTVEPRHHVKDASMYQIVKTLELRTAADNDRIAQIDEIFSGVFNKLVVKTNRDFIDFATLVDKLEDIEEANGGAVRDEPANERVTYTAPDGATIVFSVAAGRISMSTRGANSIQALLKTAQGYRFGLEGKSTLLLS